MLDVLPPDHWIVGMTDDVQGYSVFFESLIVEMEMM